MTAANCKHLAVERRVGFSVVEWICKGCGRRWHARITGGHTPQERPA